MKEVFEYRHAPAKGVIWLSAASVALLIAAITIANLPQLTQLAWVLGPVTICWMLLPRPVYGIRVDGDYLVLAAWRHPRQIPLGKIAYLRVTEAHDEINITIVYKDGHEDSTYEGDMPDIDTLTNVMAARGIPVRGIF